MRWRARLGEHDALAVAASNLQAEAEEFIGATPQQSLQAAERGMRFAEAAHADAPAHPQVVRMREIYAMALADAGFDTRAIAQWRRALDDARRAYGPDSVVEGLIQGNMVPSLRRVGEVRLALQSADRAMELLRHRLRGDSRTRALHLQYRATAWVAARRGAEAWADFDAAHDILQRLQGPASFETLDVRMARGHAAAMQGRFDAARADVDFVMQAAQRDFPANVHMVQYMKGAVLRLKGDFAAARELQSEAVARTPKDSMAPAYLMRRLPELGLDELELGHLAAARAAFEQALTIMESVQVEVAPARAEVWQGLARVHLGEGRAAEALALMQRVDAFWREFDAEHPSAREARQWLARCAAAQAQAKAQAKAQGQRPLARRAINVGLAGLAR